MDDLQILTPNDDLLDENSLPGLINGSLIYLCQKSSNNEIDHDVVECFGIGKTNQFFFLKTKI